MSTQSVAEVSELWVETDERGVNPTLHASERIYRATTLLCQFFEPRNTGVFTKVANKLRIPREELLHLRSRILAKIVARCLELAENHQRCLRMVYDDVSKFPRLALECVSLLMQIPSGPKAINRPSSGTDQAWFMDWTQNTFCNMAQVILDADKTCDVAQVIRLLAEEPIEEDWRERVGHLWNEPDMPIVL